MKLESSIKFEEVCLSSKPDEDVEVTFSESQDAASLSQYLALQKYKKVFNISLQKLKLGSTSEKIMQTLKKEYLEDSESHILLFCCGVAAQQIFVQNNFTGPVCKAPSVWSEEDDKIAGSHLAEGSFNINTQVKQSQHLYLAKNIFEFLMESSTIKSASWWYLRSLNVTSQVIDQKSEKMFKSTEKAYEKCLDLPFICSNKSLKVQFNLESSFAFLYYHQYKTASCIFNKAKSAIDFGFGFTGAMGVRTRFQTKAVAQLIMKVHRKDNSFVSPISKECRESVPKNFKLNDDTILDRVKLDNDEEEPTTELAPEEAAIVMAACYTMQKAAPVNRLKEEEMATIIQFLLDAPSGWCCYTEALRMRCKNQKDKSRTVERSLMQLEELVKLVTSSEEDDDSEYNPRLSLFYSVRPPPVWVLKTDLAEILSSLGCTRSALEIYKSLEMWECVIFILIHQERNSEAIDLCKKQIKENPTPNVLCLLGDLNVDMTNTPEHYYERAWELSNHRCTRAMSSMGSYFVSKGKHEEATECFHKSLKVFSLQVKTWYVLGITYLAIGNYEEAAKAFVRCCQLDWDNFKSWSNLALAYVRVGKKMEAFKSLSEAIRCNFDQWQLWDNYTGISADVGKFRESIVAYNRMIDIKKKHEDLGVLEVLVEAVVDNIRDADGNPSSVLKVSLLTLFERITSEMKVDYRVWALYAMLYSSEEYGREGDLTNVATGPELSPAMKAGRAVEYTLKSLNTGMTASKMWSKDERIVRNLIVIAKSFVELCDHKNLVATTQMLTPVKFSLKNMISSLKKHENEVLDVETSEKYAIYRQEVESISDAIAKKIESIE